MKVKTAFEGVVKDFSLFSWITRIKTQILS